MDVAYDHIQEETLTDDNQASSSSDKTPAQPPTLNAEFQDAYRAFSNSPWGARIGGFLGNVVKQVCGHRLSRHQQRLQVARPHRT